ncbi:hypothetical protein SAMN04487852_10841 [Prevotella sp. tf2-5]|nr:hypothetical protein SAMN04487852_10841 [Prevotella sp. tf2-5]
MAENFWLSAIFLYLCTNLYHKQTNKYEKT